MIVTLTGFMACGKSSVGKELASLLGYRFIDLDDLIVRNTGRSVLEIFKGGEAEFRSVELETLRSALSGADNLVLALGGGTVTIPEAQKIVFGGTTSVYLRTGFETIRARLQDDALGTRPLSKDAERLFAVREPIYERAAYIVDTDGKNPVTIAEEIASLIM